MHAKVIILGCGSSAGVPAITNRWGNCDPNEPKNRRTRPSIAVITDTTTLIVDTGPDFREQYNRENLQGLDGVIYTHAHADHVHGIDELRTLQRLMQRKFPVYSDQKNLNEIQQRFDYMFETTGGGFYPPVCDPNIIMPGKKITVGDIEFHAFEQDHGTTTSLGLRFSNIGYSTDMLDLNETAIETLKGVDSWIADAAAHHDDKNKVHATISKVIELNQKIGAQNVYLTHLPPTMDYMTVKNELPDGYEPAYDSLTVDYKIMEY